MVLEMNAVDLHCVIMISLEQSGTLAGRVLVGISSVHVDVRSVRNPPSPSFAGNVAQFTGLPTGFVYDAYGPKVTIFVGGYFAWLFLCPCTHTEQ